MMKVETQNKNVGCSEHCGICSGLSTWNINMLASHANCASAMRSYTHAHKRHGTHVHVHACTCKLCLVVSICTCIIA